MRAVDRARALLAALRRRLSPAERARAQYNCGDQEKWDERARRAVELWVERRGDWRPAGDRPLEVGDLGAGMERLRPLLAARLDQDVAYHPFDLLPQLPTTTRLDVREGLPARDFDLVFCLGLVEYLPADDPFARRLRERAAHVVLSFAITDGGEQLSVADRERRGWRCHHTRDEVERRFVEAGFTPVAFELVERERTGLWLFA